MATATAAGYSSPLAQSRSLSLSGSRSPDTISPVFPERAIRPLPRARLLSRLSPEQASNIVFPPDPPPISPTLNLAPPGQVNGSTQQARVTSGDVAHGHYLHHHPQSQPQQQKQSQQHLARRDEHGHLHCTCGEEVDSGEEEVEFDLPEYRYPDGPMGNVQMRLMRAAQQAAKSPSAISATSSADGYESFENTSNKKKRKIPLSNTTSMNQSQLSAEMANMGLAGSPDGAIDDGRGGMAMSESYNMPPLQQSSGAPPSGTGISGAGRGRMRQSGKVETGLRRPLGSSNPNTVNGYAPSRSGSEIKTAMDADIENTGGIISQAIKSAAEQTSRSFQQGQDSLLDGAQSTGPVSTQPGNPKCNFTFSVESESSNKMLDQQAAAAAAAQAAYNSPPVSNARTAAGRSGPNTMNTQGTQTTQAPRPPNANVGGSTRPPLPAQQQPPPPPPKSRRRPSKEYALAARQRRLQQEYTNYHHRPNKDNMWICEFCEYEDIFGVPPVALIRQYEVKDRQERKRAAERRRLLEKARAKGKKGKKGSKKNANNNNNNLAGTAPVATGGGHQPYDPNLLPPDVDGEAFYDDDEEFGDEYEPDGDGQYGYEGEYYPPAPQPAGGGGKVYA